MDVNKFADLVSRVPYIIFPAVRLQQTMREKFGGLKLWSKVQKSLSLSVELTKIEEQREKFIRNKEIKKEIELGLKTK